MRSVPPVLFVSLLGLAACAPAGSSAYVSGNARLNGDCTVSETFYFSGRYDVLSNGTDKTSCVRSYSMYLVINSNLIMNSKVSVGRVEPNALMVTHADVRLMDKNEGTLAFLDRNNNPDAARPNPYRVRTSASIFPSTGDEPTMGSVEIEAIPSVYAEKLRGYDGDSILVEVQLSGTTTGDVDVDFQPFVYPVAICTDCLSVCASDPMFVADPARLTELNSGECGDNRAQDDRVCIDPEC